MPEREKRTRSDPQLDASGRSDPSGIAGPAASALAEACRLFADLPPANPRESESRIPGSWKGLAGLAADVQYYGRWVGDQAAQTGAVGGPGASSPRQSVAAALAGAVQRARAHIVQEMVDHYSTGSFSLDATIERETYAYADALVTCLSLAVEAWTDRRSGPQLVEASPLGDWDDAVDAVAMGVRSSPLERVADRQPLSPQ